MGTQSDSPGLVRTAKQNQGKGKFKMTEFYLLDLERTLSIKQPYFWKRTKQGYTNSLRHAGIFSKKEAELIVKNDRDSRTIMVHKNIVSGILGREFSSNENNS